MTFPAQQPRTPVQPEQVGRTSMIIVAALMSGLVFFTIIALVIGSEPKPAPPMMVSYLALGLTGMNTTLRFVLPGMQANSAAQGTAGQPASERRQQLAPIYMSKVIISTALLEGAGFFNGIAYILTASTLNLGAIAVLLTIMAVTFPSQTQFDNWADQIQRDTL